MSIFDNEDHARGPVTITFGENGEYQRTFDTWEDLQDAEWGQYLEDNGIDGSVMGHPCEIEHAEFGRVWSDDQLIDFTNNRVDLHIGRDLDRDGNPDISVTTTLAEWNVYDEDGNIIRPDNDTLYYEQGPYIQRNPVDPSLYEEKLSGVDLDTLEFEEGVDGGGFVDTLEFEEGVDGGGFVMPLVAETPSVFSGLPGSVTSICQTPDVNELPDDLKQGIPAILDWLNPNETMKNCWKHASEYSDDNPLVDLLAKAEQTIGMDLGDAANKALDIAGDAVETAYDVLKPT